MGSRERFIEQCHKCKVTSPILVIIYLMLCSRPIDRVFFNLHENNRDISAVIIIIIYYIPIISVPFAISDRSICLKINVVENCLHLEDI